MTKTEYIALLQPIKIQVKKQHTVLKKKRIFRQINEWKKMSLEKNKNQNNIRKPNRNETTEKKDAQPTKNQKKKIEIPKQIHLA